MSETPETGTPPRAAASPLADARLAVGFLTRFPVGWLGGGDDAGAGTLARAVWAFPLVGALIGAAGGAALWFTAGSGLHPLASALLALAVMALVTGALHEDGLADFMDGLGGNGRDRRLEIMRDSRIGAFGVLALVFATGLKATAIASLAGPGVAFLVIVAAAAFSRAAPALSMYFIAPARSDGLGQGAGRPPAWAAGLAGLLGLAAVGVLAPAMGTGVVAVGGFGVAAALFMCWAMHAAVGGHTGDTLGTQQQVAETAVYLAAATVEVSL